VLREEPEEYPDGGDFRPDVPDVDGAVVAQTVADVQVNMPTKPGKYRLFYYVYDEHGRAATANMPILVVGD
jgi:hypothetical protein